MSRDPEKASVPSLESGGCLVDHLHALPRLELALSAAPMAPSKIGGTG